MSGSRVDLRYLKIKETDNQVSKGLGVTEPNVSVSRDDTESRPNHWIIVDDGYARRNRGQVDIRRINHVTDYHIP